MNKPNCDPSKPRALRDVDSKTSKTDKHLLLGSFLREQKIHARTYAAQGQIEMRTWDQGPALSMKKQRSTGEPTTPTIVRPVSQIGFDTPVLKPRVLQNCRVTGSSVIAIARPPNKDERNGLVRLAASKPAGRASPHKPREDKRTRAAEPSQVPKISTSASSRKRIACDDRSDEDQVARLENRKERKRMRRAIVNPDNTEHTVEPSTPPAAAKFKKGKGKGHKTQKGKEKTPAAFALMHGFVATNVGKNRLTARPQVPVGVFNKGKASEKTRVRDIPSKTHAGKMFSEDLFLNGTGKKRSPRKKRAPSPSSTSSSSSSSAPLAQTHAEEDRKHDKWRSDDIHPLLSPKRDENGRCISEIWDIESKVADASAIAKPSTLILDTAPRGWNAVELPRSACVGTASTALSADNCHERSSPSLRPSQSASQCAWRRRSLVSAVAAGDSIALRSKYFEPAQSAEMEQESPKGMTIEGAAVCPSYGRPLVPPGSQCAGDYPSAVPFVHRRPASVTISEDGQVWEATRKTLSERPSECFVSASEPQLDDYLDVGSTITHNYFSECLAASDHTTGNYPSPVIVKASFCDARSEPQVGHQYRQAATWDTASWHSVDHLEEHGAFLHGTPVDMDPYIDICDDSLGTFDVAEGFDADHNSVPMPVDDCTSVDASSQGPYDDYVTGPMLFSPTESCAHDAALLTPYNLSFDVNHLDYSDDLLSPANGMDEDYELGTMDLQAWTDESGMLSDDDGDSLVVHSELRVFAEGKALLLGVSKASTALGIGHGRVSKVEADVARSLHGHWAAHQPL